MVKFVVKKVEDIRRAPPQTIQEHKGEWAVVEVFGNADLIMDIFKDKAEAEKHCRLLTKAEEVIQRIRDFTHGLFSELSDEERAFLREYTGGAIEVEV